MSGNLMDISLSPYWNDRFAAVILWLCRYAAGIASRLERYAKILCLRFLSQKRKVVGKQGGEKRDEAGRMIDEQGMGAR